MAYMKAVIDLLEGSELDPYFDASRLFPVAIKPSVGPTTSESTGTAGDDSLTDWRPAIVEFLRREEVDRTDERHKTASLLLDSKSANKSVTALLMKMCQKLAEQTQSADATQALARNLRNANKREKSSCAQAREELRAEQQAHHKTLSYMTQEAELWRGRAIQLGHPSEPEREHQTTDDTSHTALTKEQQLITLEQRAQQVESQEQAAAALSVTLEQRAQQVELQEQAAAAREDAAAVKEHAVMQMDQAVMQREQAAVERAVRQETELAARDHHLLQQRAALVLREHQQTERDLEGPSTNAKSVQAALLRAHALRREQATQIEQLEQSAAAEHARAHELECMLDEHANELSSNAEAIRISHLENEIEARAADLEGTVMSIVQQQALVDQMDTRLVGDAHKAVQQQLRSGGEKNRELEQALGKAAREASQQQQTINELLQAAVTTKAVGTGSAAEALTIQQLKANADSLKIELTAKENVMDLLQSELAQRRLKLEEAHDAAREQQQKSDHELITQNELIVQMEMKLALKDETHLLAICSREERQLEQEQLRTQQQTVQIRMQQQLEQQAEQLRVQQLRVVELEEMLTEQSEQWDAVLLSQTDEIEQLRTQIASPSETTAEIEWLRDKMDEAEKFYSARVHDLELEIGTLQGLQGNMLKWTASPLRWSHGVGLLEHRATERPSQHVRNPEALRYPTQAVGPRLNRGGLRWAFDRWARAVTKPRLVMRDACYVGAADRTLPNRTHRTLPDRPAQNRAKPAVAFSPMLRKKLHRLADSPLELLEFNTPPAKAFKHISDAAAATSKQMSELQSMLQAQVSDPKLRGRQPDNPQTIDF